VVSLLVLVVAILLTVTGEYSRSLLSVILGFNRWSLGVAAYLE
jgi:uncharacterized membrane protein